MHDLKIILDNSAVGSDSHKALKSIYQKIGLESFGEQQDPFNFWSKLFSRLEKEGNTDFIDQAILKDFTVSDILPCGCEKIEDLGNWNSILLSPGNSRVNVQTKLDQFLNTDRDYHTCITHKESGQKAVETSKTFTSDAIVIRNYDRDYSNHKNLEIDPVIQANGSEYELKSIVYHHGSTFAGGHYTSTVKKGDQ